MSRLGVIVLAAGRSTRFSGGEAGGPHKLLARVGGSTVVHRSVQAAVDSDVGPVVVVTGAASAEVATALAGLAVRTVHAPAFAEGMATSLRRGLETLDGMVDAVLIALGDQPGVRPDAYRRVAARWSEARAAIVMPRYAGSAAPAHPTLFDRLVFDELRALRGDVGARAVIARDASRVVTVPLEWPAPSDVDTADDLIRVVGELSDGATESVGERSSRSSDSA